LVKLYWKLFFRRIWFCRNFWIWIQW